MPKRLGIFASDKGFTLIELLVTVTIIGVLAAVVTVGVSGASSNAQTKSNQGSFADVQSAVDAWLGSNPTNAATDIGFTNGTDQITTSAQWYTANGVALSPAAALSTVTGAGAHYGVIDFTQTTGNAQQFKTFFRLNAGAVACVLPKTNLGDFTASSSTVFACHN